MKVWDSIESLAEDQGISDRTAWRWLKQGRIKKKRSEGGHMVFVLSGEPTDITDTDVTDMSATDVIDTSDIDIPDVESKSVIANKRTLRNGKLAVPLRAESGLVRGLRDELEATKLSFELEKVRAAKSEWQERKDRELKTRLEEERALKLQEFQFQEGQRQAAERQARARDVIQKVKYFVFPQGMDEIIPAHILAYAYQEMEKFLSRMDVFSLPFSELVIFAQGIWVRCSKEFANELRPAFRNYWLKLARKQLNQSMRLRYQAYTEAGGSLSYRDFLLSLLSGRAPEERENFFSVVDLTYKPVSEAELEESKAIAAMMERYSR